MISNKTTCFSKATKKNDKPMSCPCQDKKRTFSQWCLDHVRPQIGWDEGDGEGGEENKGSSWRDKWQNVKEHIRIGIGFRFKF